jgi:hypothetical protein
MVAPAGSNSKPSIETGDFNVARTVSSTLLVSDASDVANVADSVVPDGIVSSRYSGTLTGGGGGGAGSLCATAGAGSGTCAAGFGDSSACGVAGFGLAPALARGFGASVFSTAAGLFVSTADGGAASAVAGGVVGATVVVAAGPEAVDPIGFGSATGIIVFNDATCDFKISVFPPSGRWTTIRSCFTSTNRPDTLAPSPFVTVTSVPSGYVSVRVQLARPTVSARTIVKCFMVPPRVEWSRFSNHRTFGFGVGGHANFAIVAGLNGPAF